MPSLFRCGCKNTRKKYFDGINKITNNPNRAITYQDKTQNLKTWGFSDIEIEYETL